MDTQIISTQNDSIAEWAHPLLGRMKEMLKEKFPNLFFRDARYVQKQGVFLDIYSSKDLFKRIVTIVCSEDIKDFGTKKVVRISFSYEMNEKLLGLGIFEAKMENYIRENLVHTFTSPEEFLFQQKAPIIVKFFTDSPY